MAAAALSFPPSHRTPQLHLKIRIPVVLTVSAIVLALILLIISIRRMRQRRPEMKAYVDTTRSNTKSRPIRQQGETHH